MNEEYRDLPNQPLDLNLEVRLLTMLAGEAADFERDQLEQLIEQRDDVAEAYERLRELHSCLMEVGTGELKGSKDEWRLPAGRREMLLAVLSSKGAANEATQAVFLAAKVQAKWSTLRMLQSFVAVAGMLLVVGLVWGLSLPAVQMARKSANHVAKSAAMRMEEAAVSSEMSGGTALQAALEIEPSKVVSPDHLYRRGAGVAPSGAPGNAGQQVGEMLQAGQPEAYYLNDNLQYSGKDAAARPLPSIPGEQSGLGQTNSVAAGNAAIGAGRYLDGSSAGGLGGYGGGESKSDDPADSIASFDMPAQPLSDFGGLAFPPLPAAPQGVTTKVPDIAAGGMRAGGMGGRDSGPGGGSAMPSDWAAINQPTNRWHAEFDAAKLDALGLQQESETLSRNDGQALPRIIVTDEKAAERGERVIEGAPGVDLLADLSSAPEPASEEREYSFGIPFTNRGRFDEANRKQVADAAPEGKLEGLALSSPAREYFDNVPLLGFRQSGKSEEPVRAVAPTKDNSARATADSNDPSASLAVNGRAIARASQIWQDLAEPGLKELAETKFARNGEMLRQSEAEGLDETSTAQNAFSTFSLHVSDVSFKLSAAALSQGEWPDASKIRIEEFVNAFDYHDPLPTQAEKVACRMEQAIHPFLMQRNILRISMRTAATGRSGGTPLRLTLLLDNSGSMERDDRRQTLQRAFEALIQQLTPADQITLVSFANRPRLLADRVPGDQASQLLQIIETLPSEGGTNIEAALQLAMEKASEQRDPAAQHRVVLLTDGAVNLGNANPEKLSAIVKQMRDAGIAFDAAGISAQDLNDEVLEALTRQGDGRYYLLDSAEAVSDGFANQIAGALRPSAKNVKVQIEFNPQRVGQYKLLGFEKHRLQTEDFRNDQVDAAEMTAAEAGVAIYQFEVRPDGVGDIGSASVRFRDLSTGQMVERTWPIPYESHPPRIEEANPSLRVSVAAALFAAKLKSEPLGDSVSLKTVAGWLAKLPAADRSTIRVMQLQSMLEQARQIRGGEE